MTNVFEDLLILVLFFVIAFFLFRTIVIAFSMFSDVPFLPSESVYKKVIPLLGIRNGDNVLDIGSGDGRVLLYASRVHPEASFVGIEKNFFLVLYSNILRTILGRKNLKFLKVDALHHDFTKYDKIYMYLLPTFVDKLFLERKKSLKKNSVLVSFHFPMGYKFSKINNISKYPVKYRGKEKYIFKWVNR